MNKKLTAQEIEKELENVLKEIKNSDESVGFVVAPVCTDHRYKSECDKLLDRMDEIIEQINELEKQNKKST